MTLLLSYQPLWSRSDNGFRADAGGISRYTNSGCPAFFTTSLVMVQIPIESSDGISYIRSIITDSRIERSPLAPILRPTASCAPLQSLLGEFQLYIVQLKQLLVLSHQGIFRL